MDRYLCSPNCAEPWTPLNVEVFNPLVPAGRGKSWKGWAHLVISDEKQDTIIRTRAGSHRKNRPSAVDCRMYAGKFQASVPIGRLDGHEMLLGSNTCSNYSDSQNEKQGGWAELKCWQYHSTDKNGFRVRLGRSKCRPSWGHEIHVSVGRRITKKSVLVIPVSTILVIREVTDSDS